MQIHIPYYFCNNLQYSKYKIEYLLHFVGTYCVYIRAPWLPANSLQLPIESFSFRESQITKLQFILKVSGALALHVVVLFLSQNVKPGWKSISSMNESTNCSLYWCHTDRWWWLRGWRCIIGRPALRIKLLFRLGERRRWDASSSCVVRRKDNKNEFPALVATWRAARVFYVLSRQPPTSMNVRNRSTKDVHDNNGDRIGKERPDRLIHPPKLWCPRE